MESHKKKGQVIMVSSPIAGQLTEFYHKGSPTDQRMHQCTYLSGETSPWWQQGGYIWQQCGCNCSCGGHVGSKLCLNNLYCQQDTSVRQQCGSSMSWWVTSGTNNAECAAAAGGAVVLRRIYFCRLLRHKAFVTLVRMRLHAQQTQQLCV